MLESGLYEQIINQEVQEALNKLPAEQVQIDKLGLAEAPSVLSDYVADLLKSVLTKVAEKGHKDEKLPDQIRLVNKLVREMMSELGDHDHEDQLVIDPAQELLSLMPRDAISVVHKSKKDIPRPLSPMRISSLFTGSKLEPSLDTEFRQEIATCDGIDMLVSFIKWSGLRLIYEDLKAFCQRGGKLRVITTSYMGATDIKAVQELKALPNCELKISYDTKRTRLHAKTYVFYRNSGFTTAYVGSSNLSNAAISSGLEWNVKIAAKELPETMQKIAATFDNYWHSEEFVFYYEDQYDRLNEALLAESRGSGYDVGNTHYFFDIRPYPYQEEILDRLDAERSLRNRFRNLVVAATGTGKTVLAAFDYKRFIDANRGSDTRLLFIAHREEILRQSMACFRTVLKNPNFGDLFVGSEQPNQMEQLFMSIQTFNSRKWTEITAADYYDYIVVDEFHHAAASSYQQLLSHYKPKILLGLTATPERMDGADVTEYFDGRISAEIRLPEAIERKLLSPFQYFAVSDVVDLSDLKWARGGYDRSELSKVYTMAELGAEQRVQHIILALNRYVTDINQVIGLGFCVSVDHARFMADRFNSAGIPSLALTAESNEHERRSAKQDLITAKLRFIFTVDLYNEGVDIPEVNTVLFLRPTESLTVFLQQLGRGLRLSRGKDCLTVLDFVGQAHKRYNYEEKFNALLSNTRHSLTKEIDSGFASVPKGCFIYLEKVAKEHILNNIKQSFSSKKGLLDRIQYFAEDSELALNFENFLKYYHLMPMDIYRYGSFSRLMVQAKVRADFNEVDEKQLSSMLKRMTFINSRHWIEFIVDVLENIEALDTLVFDELEERMFRMLFYTVFANQIRMPSLGEMVTAIASMKMNPILLEELLELLYWNYEHLDFVDHNVDLGFKSPLDLHCSYSRDQLLTAFDHPNPSSVREGVVFIAAKNVDILLITLNKSDKDYSPSTLYDDYSINEELFHWQSQSTTSETSATGQRYINHRTMGSKIVLFVREAKKDLYGNSMPYTFLGLADYLIHKDSKPMSITFKLHQRIPARYIKMTDKVQAG